MEEAANFTRYLIAYQSDGLRITGMMNRPRGDGPFPVVILNHGYYPLDVYQTGNGSKTAADYLANRGFLAIAPDLRSHAGSDDALNLYRADHADRRAEPDPAGAAAARGPARQGRDLGPQQRRRDHRQGDRRQRPDRGGGDLFAGLVEYRRGLPVSGRAAARPRRPAARPAQRRARPAHGRVPGAARARPRPLRAALAAELPEYVDTPVQIHWGSNDETVPYKWPGDLLDGLRAAGKDVEYFEYEGQPHSFTGASNQLYLRRIAEFYAQKLGQ